jgi:hypothetical protein
MQYNKVLNYHPVTTELQTEIEEALKIARNVRESILSAKGTIETQILGFETVAQILGRTTDLQWAQFEFHGYEKGVQLPPYRQSVRASINTNVDRKNFQLTSFRVGVSKLLALLEDKDLTYIDSHFDDQVVADASKFGIRATARDDYRIYRTELRSLLGLIRRELLRRLNVMITEIAYGNIPEGIFRSFQTRVNEKLTESNPEAVSALNIAYEALGKSEDPERTAQVAFACRRVIKAVADRLFPPKQGQTLSVRGKELDIGEDKFINRLDAFVASKESPNTKYLHQEIGLLRDFLSNVPESLNKGIHSNISNVEARRLVLYSYIILGDIILL